MYNPKRFQVTDRTLIHELVANYGFATLLLSNASQEISVSHLPLIFDVSIGDHGLLIGHMAKANLQWRLFTGGQKVKVIFHGPHAYVTPRWYTPAADNVPTWNYAVVHMNGTPRVVNDPEKAYQRMKELVQHHDPDWPLALSDRDREDLLNGIVVFEIDIESVEAKFKLSQNQAEPNRSGVIQGLRESANQVDRDTSMYMVKTKD